MRKAILFLFIFCGVFIIIKTKVLADDVPEFLTQATISNTSGANAYQIITDEGTTETDDETDTNSNLPHARVVTTIPYNTVIYGDSVSTAPIAERVIVDNDGLSEEMSLYMVKYNNTKYLVPTGDVSQFKLLAKDITQDIVPDNTQTNEENNPKTGMMNVVLTWVLAGLSITFSFYYFLKYIKMR